jgi:hypothetical protein
LIIFNKEDLLIKKISEKDTLKDHFPSYTGGKDAAAALEFIRNQFLDLYKGSPDNMNNIHVALLDNDHVKEGFALLEKIALKLKKDGKLKEKPKKTDK